MSNKKKKSAISNYFTMSAEMCDCFDNRDIGVKFIIQQIIESKELQRNAKVYEIVNLVSSGPIASIRLVKELNKFFLDRSGDFVLFSASQNLRTFLTLMGLDMISIQKAEKHRIPNPEQWGSYYETNPVVCYCKVPKLTLSVLFKNLRKQSHAQFAQVAQ